MNQQSIEQFVMQYLEATGCHIAEKADSHVTVRLSPEADKDLMNRSYYWGFVERTGAVPEPMSFTFVFDPEAWSKANPPRGAGAGRPPAPAATAPAAAPEGAGTAPFGAPGGGGGAGGAAPAGDSILGRYFGVTPAVQSTWGRTPNDVMAFGSRRLEQLFGVVQGRGRFVRMFETPDPTRQNPFASLGYSTWLCVNYKLEFICDMKRDELHSLAINLGTGQIAADFFPRVRRRKLTPQIPANIHLQPTSLSIDRAVSALENHIESMVKGYDHQWSEEAWKRLKEEWSRIDAYYGELLLQAAPGDKAGIEEQYRAREQEIDWQFRPRITVSVTNCGFFHLAEGMRTPIDATR